MENLGLLWIAVGPGDEFFVCEGCMNSPLTLTDSNQDRSVDFLGGMHLSE
jgi:hypothetical protein